MNDRHVVATNRKAGSRAFLMLCAIVGGAFFSDGPANGADANTSTNNANDTATTFHTKVKEQKTYTVKPLDEELSHDLVIRTGEHAPYKLYTELVDTCPILIKLSLNGKVVLSKSLPRWQGLCEPHFAFIDPAGNKVVNDDPVLRDIDGDGKPELVIEEISEGGGHPPTKLSIYRLDGSSTLRQTYAADLVDPEFKDVDKDGRYEIFAGDDSFAYWLDSAGFQSFYPPIALAFDGNTYKPSAKHTKIPPPTKSEQDKTAAELTKKLAAYKKKIKPGTKVIMPEIWNEFVKLTYRGNADSAKLLLSRLYPGATTLTIVTSDPDSPIPANATKVTKSAFWSRLCAQAKKSKYASVIAAMNSGLETPPK